MTDGAHGVKLIDRTRMMTRFGVLAAIGALAWALSRVLPPAYDFTGVYYPAIRDVWAGHFSYAASPGYLNPPWALVLLLPLGVFDAALARAVLLVATHAVVVWSLRGRRYFASAVALVAVSAPMLAIAWLGQIELFSIAGAMLGYGAVTRRSWWQFAAGLLLLLIKPQETWLIAAWLVVQSSRRWTPGEWLCILGGVATVAAITSVWLGGDWLGRMLNGAERYSAQWQNFSLWRLTEIWPTAVVLALIVALAGIALYALWRAGVSRTGLGLAAAASNVFSPYLTAPHLIMTMSLGWGLLMGRAPRRALVIYLVSLAPLLRIISSDQALNRLDVIFPVLVLIALIDAVRRTARGQLMPFSVV